VKGSSSQNEASLSLELLNTFKQENKRLKDSLQKAKNSTENTKSVKVFD
jgi:hypothetical protein